MIKKSYKVVSLGETMIRYSPKNFQRLEQASEIEMRVGGAESNFAIACARLGLKAYWISKLTDNPLGHIIAKEIARYGIDVSQVIWTNEYRVGTYYIEFGSPPRPTRVLYDRKDSAISHLEPEEVNWEVIRNCDLFHTTGITPALSTSCHKVVLTGLKEAKKAGVLTSFDINYRSKLWSPEQAKDILSSCIRKVDILFVSEDEARLIFKVEGKDEDIVRWFKKQFSCRVVVLTQKEEGALAYDGKQLFKAGAYSTETVDRVGTGDAFDAGFVYGYLTGDISKALKYAVATAALKRTIPGDIALITLKEVEELVAKGEKTDIHR